MFRRYRIDMTLAALIALALATIWLPPLLPGALLANAVLLALAALKGRRIVLDYLGLRAVPPLWRGLVTAWLLLVAVFAFAASAVVIVI